MLQFIARCKSGTERKTLIMAASRLHSVWMPFELRSRRYGRGKSRGSDVEVRPLMPYLFCEGDSVQMQHLLERRDVFGTVWFVSSPHNSGRKAIKARLKQIADYKHLVEQAFRSATDAIAEDEKEFHCTYAEGDKVLLRMGLDLVDATFRKLTDAGTYELDVPGLSFAGKIEAHPRQVKVAS